MAIAGRRSDKPTVIELRLAMTAAQMTHDDQPTEVIYRRGRCTGVDLQPFSTI